MKTKIVFLVLLGCMLALTAWLMHVPNPAQADDVPEKYHETVQKALKYLVTHQAKDGHWEGDDAKHPVAMTGLVGLALLMERTNPQGSARLTKGREAKYQANVRKAVDWLADRNQVKRDGLFFSEHASETGRYMEGHGLATLLLAGAIEDENDNPRHAKLTLILTRAVRYIEKTQSSQGGWYHTSKLEGHDLAAIATTVIQLQALKAAENVGVPVSRVAAHDAQEYLKKALGTYVEDAKPGQDRARPIDVAAVLACQWRTSPAYAPKSEWRDKWLKYCQSEIPIGSKMKFGRDELSHYYYAQALSNLGSKNWISYRTAMFDHLQSTQNKDGSWPSSSGIGIGSVYSTALWCVVLQLDKGSHPARQPEEFGRIF